jgi:hypothetical protein
VTLTQPYLTVSPRRCFPLVSIPSVLVCSGLFRVAGFYAWNQLGRRVKKGKHGIRILAPMIGEKEGQHIYCSNSGVIMYCAPHIQWGTIPSADRMATPLSRNE